MSYDPGGAERERGFALAEDLAVALRTGREYLRVWTEVPTIGDADAAAGRMDVFAMRPRWGGIHDTRAYEVKVNRRDFFDDVRSLKFTKYLSYCRRLYFAVPSGLVKAAEVPTGIGLITKTEKGGWRTLVQPTMRDVQPTREFLIGLLNHQDVVGREQRRIRDRVIAADNVVLAPQAHRMGRELSELAYHYRHGTAQEPVLTREQQMDRHYADDLLAAMKELWREQRDDDLFDSHVSPRELVRAVAGMMRDVEGLREFAKYVNALSFATPGKAEATIAKLGKHAEAD